MLYLHKRCSICTISCSLRHRIMSLRKTANYLCRSRTLLFENASVSNLNFRILSRPYNTDKWRSTVYALSSGQGKCGVAVFRISGPTAREAMKLTTNIDGYHADRGFHYRKIYNPVTREHIDRGLVLWFPGNAPCVSKKR